MQKLKENFEFIGDELNHTKPISETVISFLNSESHPAFTILQEDIKSHSDKHTA